MHPERDDTVDNPTVEFGGSLQPPSDEIRRETLNVEMGLKMGLRAGELDAHGKMTGPASLAVLWFGLADAVVGGAVWAVAGTAAGITVIVIMLLAMVFYLRTRPQDR
jgi:hypothetical protein